jgi:hypothetical protein
MFTTVWCLGLLAVTAGQPETPSWRYTLGSVVDPVPDVVPLTVTDARPRWERFATNGDVSVIPLELFDASPGRWLHNALQTQFTEAVNRPARLHLHLTSFRIFINHQILSDAVRFKKDLEMIGDSIDEADDLAGGIAGGLIMVGLYHTIFESPRRMAEMYERKVNKIRPSRSFGYRHPEHICCQIEATVVYVRPDETRHEVVVRTLVNIPSEEVKSSTYQGDYILQATRAAVAQFATQVIKAAPLPTEASRSVLPAQP